MALTTREYDCTQAIEEGWTISAVYGAGNGDNWRLERLDCREVFPSDEAAWAHVVKQALGGSDYHARALKWLKKHQQNEFDLIMSTTHGGM